MTSNVMDRARVYLDHAATTPMCPEALAALQRCLGECFGNASSLHSFGRHAAAALDEARTTLACAIGARSAELVFTASGTESNNLALRGAALAARRRSKGNHLVTTAVEHQAVEATVRQLCDLFGFEVTFLPVDGHGQVDPDDVRRALRRDTVLVSVMLANNEVGTLQPVREIGAICREYGVLFHTDAVQASAYLDLNVRALNVDMLSMAAHKFYGPKGVGLLYLRENTPYVPPISGGGHERGKRPGTVNVPGAAGAAAAMRFVTGQREAQAARLAALRDRLIEGVLASVPDARLSGHPTERLPNHASFVFKDVDGESLLMALDVEGFAVGTGSACSSGNPEPSPVLLAMGIPPEWALGSLRVTLGYGTTEAEIDAFLEVLPRCVAQVRAALAEVY